MSFRVSLAAALCCAIGLTNTATATSPRLSLVPAAALQALLPTPDGWTKGVEKAGQVALSATCDYTFAAVVYTQAPLRAKITLADSGANADNLLVLAPMVASLPEGFMEKVPPATVVSRGRFAGFPAAERWDGAKREGDLTVVVDGRFVASLEGSQIDSLEPLRGLLGQIDLKKLAELK